jgi:hypothetical protein
MKVQIVFARGASGYVDGVVEALEAGLRSGGFSTSQLAVGDPLDLAYGAQAALSSCDACVCVGGVVGAPDVASLVSDAVLRVGIAAGKPAIVGLSQFANEALSRTASAPHAGVWWCA